MLRRFSVSVGGRVISAALQMVVFAIFARVLGVEVFGYFAAVISITLVAMSFLELGMGARVLRSASDPAARASLATFAIVRFFLILFLPFVAVLYASMQLIPVWVAVVASLYAAGEASGDLAVGILQGEKRSVLAMALLVLRRLGALLPMLLSATAEGVAVGAALAGALGALAFAVLALLRWARPRSIFSLVRENVGIMLSGGAANMSQLDVAIVNGTLGSAGAGLYASATRLFNPISLLIGTLIQVLIPELASAGSVTNRLRVFRRARRIVALFAVGLALCSVLAPQVVVWIYGEAFSGAAPVAAAVFIGAGISALSQIHLAWYYADRVPPMLPAAMWVAVGTGLGAIAILSIFVGLIGSAFGILLMQTLILGAVIVPWRSSMRRLIGEDGA